MYSNYVMQYLRWRQSTLREENKFGRKECRIKDCELDL